MLDAICEYCFYLWKMESLPDSHVSPCHPVWHLPSQWPVTLSHAPGTPQLLLQLFRQLYPYIPAVHSVKTNETTQIEYEQ